MWWYVVVHICGWSKLKIKGAREMECEVDLIYGYTNGIPSML